MPVVPHNLDAIIHYTIRWRWAPTRFTQTPKEIGQVFYTTVEKTKHWVYFYRFYSIGYVKLLYFQFWIENRKKKHVHAELVSKHRMMWAIRPAYFVYTTFNQILWADRCIIMLLLIFTYFASNCLLSPIFVGSSVLKAAGTRKRSEQKKLTHTQRLHVCANIPSIKRWREMYFNS